MKSEKEVKDVPPQDTPYDKEVRTKEGRLTPAASYRFMRRLKESREKVLGKKSQR